MRDARYCLRAATVPAIADVAPGGGGRPRDDPPGPPVGTRLVGTGAASKSSARPAACAIACRSLGTGSARARVMKPWTESVRASFKTGSTTSTVVRLDEMAPQPFCEGGRVGVRGRGRGVLE